MPLIHITTSAPPLAADQADALLKKLSAAVAHQLHKPERYVMTCLVPHAPMTFAGTSEPSCSVELKSIGGLTPAVNQALSAELCKILNQGLGVAQDRIYLVFSDVPARSWGHDGSTFG